MNRGSLEVFLVRIFSLNIVASRLHVLLPPSWLYLTVEIQIHKAHTPRQGGEASYEKTSLHHSDLRSCDANIPFFIVVMNGQRRSFHPYHVHPYHLLSSPPLLRSHPTRQEIRDFVTGQPVSGRDG